MASPESQPRPDFGLPRSRRLVTQRDFRRVYGQGRRAGGRSLTVVALARRGERGAATRLAPGEHRVGLSVSKAHGGAVRRNAIKRRLREAFRQERSQLPGAYDVVLIPRVREGHWSVVELRRELLRLVQKVHGGGGHSRRERGRKEGGRSNRKGSRSTGGRGRTGPSDSGPRGDG